MTLLLRINQKVISMSIGMHTYFFALCYITSTTYNLTSNINVYEKNSSRLLKSNNFRKLLSQKFFMATTNLWHYIMDSININLCIITNSGKFPTNIYILKFIIFLSMDRVCTYFINSTE